MTGYNVEFHGNSGPYENGRIVVNKPGSSLTQRHYAFNVTKHGGLELPKFRDEEPPREVWEVALDCLLENVRQNTSPVFQSDN